MITKYCCNGQPLAYILRGQSYSWCLRLMKNYNMPIEKAVEVVKEMQRRKNSSKNTKRLYLDTLDNLEKERRLNIYLRKRYERLKKKRNLNPPEVIDIGCYPLRLQNVFLATKIGGILLKC